MYRVSPSIHSTTQPAERNGKQPRVDQFLFLETAGIHDALCNVFPTVALPTTLVPPHRIQFRGVFDSSSSPQRSGLRGWRGFGALAPVNGWPDSPTPHQISRLALLATLAGMA
jgi:hypothetical protein